MSLPNELSIKQFKNKYEGSTIYVIASGATCDYIDQSFFEDKITVGVNQVHKKFKTNFLVRKELKFIHKIMKEKHKNTKLICSVGDCGGRNNENIRQWKPQYQGHLYYYKHQRNIHQLRDFTPIETKDYLVVSWSTITTAIHFAYYLGAKNIMLVGHDCGTIDDKSNFTGYHVYTGKNQTTCKSQKNEEQYKNWLKKIENQTLALKKYLKEKKNVNIYSLNPFINFGLEGHTYKR